MLQSVIATLRRHAPVAASPHPPAETGPGPNLAPLYALLEQRRRIDVVCQRSGDRYQSLILALDAEHGHIVLDELFPGGLLADHRPGDQFAIQYRLGTQLLHCAVELQALEGTRLPLSYRCRLLGGVDIRQRRHQPRLDLDQGSPLTVELNAADGSRWLATALDISAGGMRLVLGGNLQDRLLHQPAPVRCRLRLSDELVIDCRARVRNCSFARSPSRRTTVSLAFVDLSRARRLQLQQLASNLASEVSYT